MNNIIQIEELVYGRLPHVSKADWIAMLTEHGAHPDYTSFENDYLLLEYNDYRFANGKMISSERLHYNINYSTYDGVKNGPSSEDTIEIQVVRYNKRSDRYYVSYAHYLPSEERSPDVSYIYAEADAPSSASTYQPPREKHTPAPQPQPVAQEEYHKPWRRLPLLKELYEKGYSLEQIICAFECTKEGVLYQLKTHLGIEHPFDRPSAPQPQPQQPTNQPNTHQIGDRVIHSKYGKGVIRSIDEKYVVCRFGTDLERKFLYPQAFEQGFLQ